MKKLMKTHDKKKLQGMVKSKTGKSVSLQEMKQAVRDAASDSMHAKRMIKSV